jgi:hypothetical protein
MDENDKWDGVIFPMTDNPEKEPFQEEQTVEEFLKYTLQDPKDHKFYYGVHYESKDWNRVLQAWKGEIMLFPFPSNKLESGAIVFFRWHDNLYGYGKVEKVIANNRADLNFPLNGNWQCCIYPYIVKFYENSINVAKTAIPLDRWSKALNTDTIPLRNAYPKLTIEEIKSLMELF